VVNHKNNLAYLCPNHHAELDKGLLTSEQLVLVKSVVDKYAPVV